MNDLYFIKLFFNQDFYKKYKGYLSKDFFIAEAKTIFDSLKHFYKEHNVDSVTPELFKTWLLEFHKPNIAEEEKQLLKFFLNKVEELKSNIDLDVISKELVKKDLQFKLQLLIENNASVDEIDALLHSYRETELDELEECPTDFDECMKVCDRDNGLRWELDCLNRNVGSVILGDFIGVGARPNIGKTSFVVSQVGHMSTQLEDDQLVLWFNTEGVKQKIRMRLYSKFLQKPIGLLKIARSRGLNLTQLYLDCIGGKERIKIFDVRQMSIYKIEAIMKKYKKRLRLVVLDIIDHIKDPASEGNRANTLGDVYQWARECSGAYAPIIATSQLSQLTKSSLDRQRFPLIEDMKDSKTDKQGALTTAIFLGCQNGQAEGEIRYLSTPKNKEGEGGDGYRTTIALDKKLATYREAK